ncbi:MAG: hypothetical protein IJ806_10135 [Ruminococcus sp.]|nr:hypothetical protein [Ruminococcus sp.]
MNPMALVKLRGMLEQFRENHPKIPAFLAAAANGMDEGSVIDIKVTNSAGQHLNASIKLDAQDIEFLQELRSALSED